LSELSALAVRCRAVDLRSCSLRAKQGSTIGVLTSLSPTRYAANLDQLRKGLHELGYVEGRNLRIEARYADAKLERLPQLATELAAVPIDVLVTAGSHVTRVTRKATRDVPIVMAYAGDPVSGGLADRLSRPGGRITGLTTLSTQLGGKRLEILKEILPKMDDVAVLWNPDVPERVVQFNDTQAAAKKLGVSVHSFEARRASEIELALNALVVKRPDALILLSDALLDAHLRTISAFVAKNKLVMVHQRRSGAQLVHSYPTARAFRTCITGRPLTSTRSLRAPSRRTCRSSSLLNSSS
jgi:putative tryptophan/tyrosine transport system substrate-binding protein